MTSRTDPVGQSPTGSVAVLVVAGGAGRRLGGVDKPAIVLDGRTLLDRTLDAAAGADLIVVIGPVRDLPADVLAAREDPPGSGPAAAVAAGVAVLAAGPAPDLVVLVAADLPRIDRAVVQELLTASVAQPGGQAWVGVDGDGRRQYLLSVLTWPALQAAVGSAPSWTGAPLRSLFAALSVIEVPITHTDDIDTPEDLRRWGINISDTDRTPGRT